MVHKMIIYKTEHRPFLHQRVLIIYPLRGKYRHDVKTKNKLIFYEEQNQESEWKALAQRTQALARIIIRNKDSVSEVPCHLSPFLPFPGFPFLIAQVWDISL